MSRPVPTQTNSQMQFSQHVHSVPPLHPNSYSHSPYSHPNMHSFSHPNYPFTQNEQAIDMSRQVLRTPSPSSSSISPIPNLAVSSPVVDPEAPKKQVCNCKKSKCLKL